MQNELHKDLIGRKFNRLVVIKFAGQNWDGHQFHNCWLCKCDCGNSLVIKGYSLQNGSTKSCGCLRKELASKKFVELNKKQIGKGHPNYINGKSCGANLK